MLSRAVAQGRTCELPIFMYVTQISDGAVHFYVTNNTDFASSRPKSLLGYTKRLIFEQAQNLFTF